MAPLTKAIHVQFKEIRSDISVYHGTVDSDWTVFKVPNGGYILGLILESAIQRQSSSYHPDPIHVTAHFLRSAAIAAFEVHVRIIKAGKGFTNISADFVQEGTLRITTHIVFGVLASVSDPSLTIEPPSPWAKRTPLFTHPSMCPETPPRGWWNYKTHLKLADDPEYRKKYLGIPQGGMEWGTYLTLREPEEVITTPTLALMADTFRAVDQVRTEGELRDIRKSSWAPTMVMTLEFKFPIPKPSEHHASRTVAVYSAGKFMNDPFARHDTYIEIWTAPDNIEEGIERKDWREHQRCLAVSTQMAILVPGEVNARKGQKEAKL